LKKAVIPTYCYQPSNPTNHLTTQHEKHEVPEYWERLGEKVDAPTQVVDLTKMRGGKVQSTLTAYSKAEEVIKRCNELLYTFFNTANISINQTKNQHLHELLRLLVDYAHLLKFRRNQICFSPWRYKAQECKTFIQFTSFLTKAVTSAREYYKDTTGKHIPFITVSHDAWDSKRRDMLGCSVHFVHPQYWKMISIPIGLKYLESKKAVEVVEQLNKILIR
jgi:hypothetical protein